MRHLLLVLLFAVSTLGFGQKIATFPYFEDFENGQGGWNSGGSSSSWAFGKPNKSVINSASSGNNSWVTGGLGGGTYNPNENSNVSSPEFDFTNMQQPVVQLRVWWNAEFSWDGAAWQATTNNGGSWLTIGSTNSPGNWYTDNTISGNPGGQQQGWSGRTSTGNGSNGWVTAQHGMNALIGEPSVRFRVAFGSDGSVQDEGFAFDDIFIFDRKANDVGILNVVSPVQDCGFGGTYDVEIRCRNFGFQVASGFNLVYQINDNAPVVEAFSGTVASDNNFTYTFNQQAVLNQDTNYAISVWIDWPQDEENSNDSILNQGLKNVMPFGPTTFEGFEEKYVGDVLPGWNEGNGNNPSTGDSDWTGSDSIQSIHFGHTTAKINLRNNGINDWLLTPSFVVPQASRLFYSVAITSKDSTGPATMGADDFVKVRISTDCGLTWTDEMTYDVSSGLGPNLQDEVIIITKYQGQEIIVGFQANTGLVDPENYDFHVSLQQARFVYPNDVGIIQFWVDTVGVQTMQAGAGGYVSYTLKNFGSNQVEDIPILAEIGNSTYQHIQYQAVNSNGEEDILAGGYWAYSNGPAQVPVKIYTLYPSDTINVNDTLKSFITVLGVTGLGGSEVDKGVRVFPNPSDGQFRIDFGKDIFFDRLEVLDPSGRTIVKRSLVKEIDGLNLDLRDKELDPGTYILNLIGETDRKSVKLSIK